MVVALYLSCGAGRCGAGRLRWVFVGDVPVVLVLVTVEGEIDLTEPDFREVVDKGELCGDAGKLNRVKVSPSLPAIVRIL